MFKNDKDYTYTDIKCKRREGRRAERFILASKSCTTTKELIQIR
jgi:hypothetical protein